MFLALQTGSAGAAIYHVKPAGTGIGANWANAATLRTALLLAQSGDEIWVTEGMYKPEERLDPNNPRTATFFLKVGVAVYGGFQGVETARDQRNWRAFRSVLSGDLAGNDGANFAFYAENAYHVVIGANNSTFDGFTVRGGNANLGSTNDKGAGMFIGWNNTATSMTVSNCVFTLNFAEFGQGAGMYIHAGSTPTIQRCTFLSNKAFFGAGAYNSSSSPSFVNCVFSANVAQSGAAMYNFLSAPSLVNCTMNRNVAAFGGASLYNSSGTSGGASPLIVNSILWGSNQEVFRTGNSNPLFRHSDVQGCGGSGAGWSAACGQDGGGNLAVDPGFVNGLDPDGPDNVAASSDDGLRLQAGRPCVNAGTSTGAPGSDILFVSRPQNSLFDMGAYELPAAAPATATPTRRPATPTRTPTPRHTPAPAASRVGLVFLLQAALLARRSRRKSRGGRESSGPIASE